MSKLLKTLLLLVMFAVLIVPVGVAQDATETPTETPVEDVLETVVMPRLEEYATLLPELERYNTIGIAPFLELLFDNPDIVILDVRQPAELETDGIIDGSIHIPLRELGANINLLPDLDATIIVVCKGGFRATIAMTALHILGYENAYVLIGGFGAWVGEDMPIDGELLEVEAGEVPAEIDPLLLEYVTDYLANIPDGWRAIAPAALAEQLIDNPPDFLLDVRSQTELDENGYIEGSQHIWINEFWANLDLLPEDPEAKIVVYCATSYRGGIIATMMGLMGYTNVVNLSGGISAWITGEFPVVK